jgi:hypothetical protein
MGIRNQINGVGEASPAGILMLPQNFMDFAIVATRWPYYSHELLDGPSSIELTSFVTDSIRYFVY